MNEYLLRLRENARSVYKVKTICGVAMFFALNVVLNLFASIQITNELKIGVASIATATSCFFYGPIPNLIVAPLLDFVNYIVKPYGSYFPIYMLATMASVLIFSAFFYRQEKITLLRCLLCRITYDVIVSLLLNTLFTTMLWETPFWSIIPAKLIKNIISLPIQTLLLYFTMKISKQIQARIN